MCSWSREVLWPSRPLSDWVFSLHTPVLRWKMLSFHLPFGLLIQLASRSSPDAGLALFFFFLPFYCFSRWGVQEGWSDGPNVTQEVRSRTGLEWSLPHSSWRFTFQTPHSPQSHIPTCSGNNPALYDLLNQDPFACTLIPKLTTPKLCILHSSLGSPCTILPFLHACFLVYRHKCLQNGQVNEWMNKWMSSIWSWCGIVWKWYLFLPLRQTSFQYKSKVKAWSSRDFLEDSSSCQPCVLLILPCL